MFTRLNSRLVRRLSALVLVGGLATGAAVATAAPASAATLSGSNVNLRACVDLGNPICGTPVGTTGNAGIVKMRCWRDGSTVTGNYRSQRWFLVMLTDEREGYIHSSFVTNQQNVPECTTLSYVRAADFAISQNNQRYAPTNIANSYSANDWAPGPFGEWSGDCAKFSGSAYRSNGVAFPQADAYGQYRQLAAAGKILGGIPRYGSAVFYAPTSTNKYGHTAIYIGGKSIMSTQGFDNYNQPVVEQDLYSHPNYLGYALL